MNIIVNSAQVNFVEGKLVLAYFNVSFSAGQFPNSLSGTLQIKPDQGVTLETSQADVATVAKKLIQAMVADTASEGNN
ncbi:hypothetical protein [Leuconostoc citreum]|uniref:hypothetical protein n=1 Tax=Leuconostoc citreum TaxID=33964 RepID=UPI0021A52CBA|nr:hypothetical protein [Leuconostoc citreum]MCT3076884.1 hypothetical protein [Leuconostoc citreum]